VSTPWFHAPQLPAVGDVIALDRDEAKHAVGVRRMGAGDTVTVFDGAGGIAQASMTGERDRAGGVLVRVVSVDRRPRTGADVLVGVAPPKGDRFSTMLDMLGQLGVAGIVPLVAQHAVVDAESIKRARAERILLEACKQSRGAWLPELRTPASPAEFVRIAIAEGRTVLVAHPGGGAPDACRAARVAIAIGPEGGFAQAEVESMLAAGAQAVDLGSTILRVETAAVALAAAFRARPAG
jgi:16S rRNA (uracil1498-N3)-methyltransferase